ncbi:MAG: extracellular solute-binding protein, partial [Candidatus Scatosoma sp.]
MRLTALAIGLATVSLFAFAGCGGSGSSGTDVTIDESGNLVAAADKAKIQIWAYCDGDEAARNKALTEAFNQKYKQYNIEAKFTQKPSSSYETTMKPTLGSESAPDVFLVADNYYKQWATLGFMENLDPYINNASPALNMRAEIDDMFEGAVGRYLYDVTTTTSTGPDAHYYGLPKGTGACSIYYNKNYIANAGIKIISVYGNELEEFNSGAADAQGNTKASLGISGTVKAVGYDEDLKVFNNRIPMNWAECDALAEAIQNNSKNKAAGCKYGYLTSWWFNYGFSVGGSCIGYVPTDDAEYNGGYYTFTLVDATVNYKVKEGKSVTVNGTTYKEGEIVSYNDKFSLDDTLAADCDILPSQRQAFSEYL